MKPAVFLLFPNAVLSGSFYAAPAGASLRIFTKLKHLFFIGILLSLFLILVVAAHQPPAFLIISAVSLVAVVYLPAISGKLQVSEKLRKAAIQRYATVHEKREEEILAYLRKTKKISTLECSRLLNVSDDTALRELRKLKAKGLIEEKGRGNETYYVPGGAAQTRIRKTLLIILTVSLFSLTLTPLVEADTLFLRNVQVTGGLGVLTTYWNASTVAGGVLDSTSQIAMGTFTGNYNVTPGICLPSGCTGGAGSASSVPTTSVNVGWATNYTLSGDIPAGTWTFGYEILQSIVVPTPPPSGIIHINVFKNVTGTRTFLFRANGTLNIMNPAPTCTTNCINSEVITVTGLPAFTTTGAYLVFEVWANVTAAGGDGAEIMNFRVNTASANVTFPSPAGGTTLPQFFFNATNFISGNQYNPSDNYGFQVNITNSDGVYGVIKNATFELGMPVGTLTNYTNYTTIMVQNYTNLTFINFTQDQLGPAGTYNFTWYANNTANSWNKTQTVAFTVAKNTSMLMRLFLNGTENNKTYNQNNIANFTAYLNLSRTITLRSNYTGFIDRTGTQTIFNYTTLATAGNFFNLTAFWNGDENYTASQEDYLFNVTAAAQQLNMTVRETISFLESYPEIQSLFRASPQTVSLAETQNGLRNVFGPAGDFVSFGDALGRLANLFRAQPEKISVPDSGGKLRSSYLASGELITLPDSNIKVRNVYLLQGDAISLLDSYPRLLSLFRLSNENISLYEAQSRMLNFMKANGDIIAITDGNNQRFYLFRSSPDTISVYDSELNLRSVFETQSELLNINDAFGRILNLFRLSGDKISVVDGSGNIRSVYLARNELVSLGDIASRIANLFRGNAETITVLDSGGKIRSVYVSQNELVSFGDIANRIASFFRINAETISLYDAASTGQHGIFLLTVPETISLSDYGSNMRNVYQVRSELVSLNSIANRILNLFRLSSENTNIYDSGVKTRFVYNIGTDTITITDGNSRIINLMRNGQETINIFDSNSRLLNIMRIGTDAVSIYDSSGKMRSSFGITQDNILLLDSDNGRLFLLRSSIDTINLFDMQSKTRFIYNNGQDTITISDGQSRILNLYRNGLETINIYDSDGRLLNFMKVGSDSIIIYDSEGNLRNVYQLPKDAILLLDSSSGGLSLFRANSEPINILDSILKSRGIFSTGNEIISLNSISNRILNFFRTQPDIINIYDSNLKARGVYQNGSEAISLSEAQVNIRNVFKTQSEILNIYDSYARMASLFRLSGDTANLYDAQSRLLNFMRANNDTLQITDSSGKIVYLVRISQDQISVFDGNMRLRGVYLVQSELLNFSDIANRILSIFRMQGETINIYDSASHTGGVQNILISILENIGFSESPGANQMLFRSNSEIISLNDIVVRIRSLFRVQSDITNIYDSGGKLRSVYQTQNEFITTNDIADRIMNFFRASPEAINIGDSTGRLLNIFRAQPETATVLDSGGKLRSAYQAQNELIGIGDAGNRLLGLFRTNTESLLISDTGIKIRYAFGSGSELINVYTVSSSIKNLFKTNGDTLQITDSSGKTVYLVRVSQDQISVYDSTGKMRGVYLVQSELLSFSDIANRILSLFRAQGETVNIYDSISKSGGIQNILRSILENIGITDSSSIKQILFRSNPELISLNDIADRLRSLFSLRGETLNVLDSSGKARSVFLSQGELLNLNDIAVRITGFFRAGGETININDSTGRTRNIFLTQNELVNLYDSYGKARNVYLGQGELISLNDFANRMLNLFRLAFENISIYDLAGKPRMVNITSFTAQASLYQNQYQTFDLALNNTGQDNTSVDYNITIYNSAGSVVDTVQCPASTCPYNLAVGQTLISTTSWFTGSNAVGSYTAQAVAFYGGANVSGNVPFSIVATPSQTPPSPGGGSGGYAVSTPVVQPILPLGNIGVEFSGFTVLREITAGEAFAAGVRIKNSDKIAHGLTIAMSGLPESWITITPDKQVIPANSEAVANILIATPPNIVPADYRVETSVSSEGGTVSKSFFIMRVKNTPDILNVRPAVEREVRIDKSTNTTEVSIFVRNGNNPVQMTRVTERIPKALAQSVSDVSFDTEPSKVLEKDPVVQWDVVFNPGEEDTKIIKYRVKKILDDYSQYIYWNLEQLSVYPYLAGALPFSFKSSANTLVKNQFNPVTIELANDGNASFDATLSFETPEGWVIIPKEVSRTVKPGKTGSFPFEIKPEIASDGPYALTLKAVIDRKTYSQQINFYVSSFKPEQLILPAIIVIIVLLAAYAIVRARTRRSRPRISHMLDVIRDRN